jgi:hypothetical protein
VVLAVVALLGFAAYVVTHKDNSSGFYKALQKANDPRSWVPPQSTESPNAAPKPVAPPVVAPPPPLNPDPNVETIQGRVVNGVYVPGVPKNDEGNKAGATSGAGGAGGPPKPPDQTSAVESKGAKILANGEHAAHTDKNKTIPKTIRATQGEAEAYKEALRQGEIGLQRPGKVSEGGVDFITATENRINGEVTILITDVKTSTIGKFPAAQSGLIPIEWGREVEAAVASGRLDLGNKGLENRVRDAFRAGRVFPRQINVDYSPKGQGKISGF